MLALALTGLTAGSTVVPLYAAKQRFVPLPPPRPMLDAPWSRSQAAAQIHEQKQSSQTQTNPTQDAGQDGEACRARLRAADIRFDTATMRLASNAACTIENPVRLRSITPRTHGITEVRLPEEPVVSCQFAEQLAGWLDNLVAPVIAGRTSAELKAVRTGPGYECRNRNGAPTGKLSAHAVGKAIDISAFELSNGKLISIKPNGDEAGRNVVDSVRTAACGWFTTVLGPGSDAAHTDHMHVDIAPHGTSDRYRICQ
jgi:hypothetical protein